MTLFFLQNHTSMIVLCFSWEAFNIPWWLGCCPSSWSSSSIRSSIMWRCQRCTKAAWIDAARLLSLNPKSNKQVKCMIFICLFDLGFRFCCPSSWSSSSIRSSIMWRCQWCANAACLDAVQLLNIHVGMHEGHRAWTPNQTNKQTKLRHHQ